ncbi:putative methyltransferase [Microlunatus phosphovorus NM-1]|uniref:Putative methyltransferase n=2 Tax=Microlunatus phosphovorus TaxID=29405 RepID=F5XPM0_MICPN|nr:putative methyltransferase [Microlunatus phosphovorus NM-1]
MRLGEMITMAAQDPARLFAVAADAYDRLMGRYLPTLGVAFGDAAEVGSVSGQRALDVGCGPGGLTTELVRRLGAEQVAAIDPSSSFVEACRERHPGVDVRQGVAEELPWAADSFDVTLGSLIAGFLRDPARAAAEMCRVTRPGGRVGLCFWEIERMPLITTYWQAVSGVDPAARGEAELFGRRAGQLSGLLTDAGLETVRESSLLATARYADIDDWWSSFTGGAGPVGAQYTRMDDDQRARVRAHGYQLLGSPTGPFELDAYAWCAVGRVPI